MAAQESHYSQDRDMKMRNMHNIIYYIALIIILVTNNVAAYLLTREIH